MIISMTVDERAHQSSIGISKNYPDTLKVHDTLKVQEHATPLDATIALQVFATIRRIGSLATGPEATSPLACGRNLKIKRLG